MDGALTRERFLLGGASAGTSTFIHVLCPAVVIYGGAESQRTRTPDKTSTLLQRCRC